MTRQNELAQILAMANESLREAQAARAHTSELVAEFGSQMLNSVLEVGTGVIDASGQFSREFRAPFAAVSISNPYVPAAPVTANGLDGTVTQTLSLPIGQALRGLDITSYSTASGGVNFTATVSGTAAAVPIGYQLRYTTSGMTFGTRFPDPLAPAAGQQITLTIPGAVSAPAVGATLYAASGGLLVVTNSPRQGVAPASGVGLFDVPAGVGMTRRMVGSTLTAYGVAGQRFSYTIFARPQPETFGRIA